MAGTGHGHGPCDRAGLLPAAGAYERLARQQVALAAVAQRTVACDGVASLAREVVRTVSAVLEAAAVASCAARPADGG